MSERPSFNMQNVPQQQMGGYAQLPSQKPFWKSAAFIAPLLTLCIVLAGGFFLYQTVFSKFAVPSLTIDIDAGSSLDTVMKQLETSGVISGSQKIVLSAVVQTVEGERGIQQGIYRFSDNESLYSIAERLLNAEYKIEPVKVTLPEGFTRMQMAETLERVLPRFSSRDFLSKTDSKEGYLFPDTYYFLPHASTDEVIAKLESTFVKKIAPLSSQIATFGKPLNEVIIMASILEMEARQKDTRRVVAGILWKRIKEKMPLQVDATFVYAIGKNSFDLTMEDLRTDGPYNSYTRTGLPPTPIANPGLESIEAAVTPISTKYYYFLTGTDGNMYYAKTHAEHVLNKKRYLK